MRKQEQTSRPARRVPAGRFTKMMRRLHRVFILPAVITTLMGCTVTSVTTTAAIESPPAPLPTTTAAPSATVVATVTPRLPTATPSATAAISPEANLEIQCIDVVSQISGNKTVEGIVVLRSREGVEVLLLDLATGIKIQLDAPRENLLNLTVSPDRKWLAYKRVVFADYIGGELAESQLVIATAKGTQFGSFPWEEGWAGLHWFNDTQLAILIPKDDIENRVSRPAAFLLFDPFTSERRMLDSDYPSIYDFGPIPYWQGLGVTAYNSALSHVIYMRGESPGAGIYALWDIRSSQLVTTFFSFDFERTPVWSPDGTRAILAANPIVERDWLNFELYEISLDGRVTQRTNLTAHYPTTYIQSYSWAPDGRKIAFWLNTEMPPLQDQYFGKQSLATLNLDTGEVINHCVAGNTETKRSQFIDAPIWSPSGQQLLVESGSFEEGTRMILVDLTRGIATQVAENMIPVGWMQAP